MNNFTTQAIELKSLGVPLVGFKRAARELVHNTSCGSLPKRVRHSYCTAIKH